MDHLTYKGIASPVRLTAEEEGIVNPRARVLGSVLRSV